LAEVTAFGKSAFTADLRRAARLLFTSASLGRFKEIKRIKKITDPP
jgi:hypothetical protein